MPAFQQPFPELGATAPIMQGEVPQLQTPLHQMRRQQLHDLAIGYGVSVENGGTKDDILPPLLAAHKAGVFLRPPKHPEYARRASRNSDDPPLPKLTPGAPPVRMMEPEIPDYRSMDIGQLIEACRTKGIDTDRRGGDWMIKQLEASHGVGAVAA